MATDDCWQQIAIGVAFWLGGGGFAMQRVFKYLDGRGNLWHAVIVRSGTTWSIREEQRSPDGECTNFVPLTGFGSAEDASDMASRFMARRQGDERLERYH